MKFGAKRCGGRKAKELEEKRKLSNRRNAMWTKLKALPVLPKILLSFVVVMVLYGIGHSHHARTFDTSSFDESTADRSSRSQDGGEQVRGEQTGGERQEVSDQRSQLLAQFQAQHAQVMAEANQCMAQLQETSNQNAQAAMNGMAFSAGPACQQNMAQWTAQAAYLETEIYKLQGGDQNASVRQVSGIAADSGTPSSYYRPDADDGTAAVERTTREGIRGHSLYTDEDGKQYELDTQPYYYRNRTSGQLVGSEQPNPPNDGRDYEQMTPQE
jgi:hypothetical protein